MPKQSEFQALACALCTAVISFYGLQDVVTSKSIKFNLTITMENNSGSIGLCFLH